MANFFTAKLKEPAGTMTKANEIVKVIDKEEKIEVKEKELKDLGVLKVKSKLFISSLPSEVQSIVIKPDDSGIRLSAVISPQKFRIRVSEEDAFEGTRTITPCKITTPTLLMSIKYADNPVFGQVHVSGGIRLFALNTKVNDKIMVKPYRLSNVHLDGDICWGDLPVPCDLKSAYNTYWSSLFTDDLLDNRDEDEGADYFEGVLDYVKKYRSKILKHKNFRNMTEFVCGKKYWAAPKGADAVLISTDKYLLNQIPELYWFRNENEGDLPRVIALANLIKDHWVFESGTFKFSILKDFVTFQPRFNKKLSDAKKKYAKLEASSIIEQKKKLADGGCE